MVAKRTAAGGPRSLQHREAGQWANNGRSARTGEAGSRERLCAIRSVVGDDQRRTESSGKQEFSAPGFDAQQTQSRRRQWSRRAARILPCGGDGDPELGPQAATTGGGGRVHGPDVRVGERQLWSLGVGTCRVCHVAGQLDSSIQRRQRKDSARSLLPHHVYSPGTLLPGRVAMPTLVEQEMEEAAREESKSEYYAALEAADRACLKGNIDVSEMMDYLGKLLHHQVHDSWNSSASVARDSSEVMGASGVGGLIPIQETTLRRGPPARLTSGQRWMVGILVSVIIGAASIIATCSA